MAAIQQTTNQRPTMKLLLSLLTMITMVIANASATTTTFEIRCTDESEGKCITLYFPTGVVTIPGKTYSNQTSESFTPCGPGQTYSDNAFIHDPSNEEVGTGFVNANVCTNLSTKEGTVYSNPSTVTYNAYSVWLAAVSQ